MINRWYVFDLAPGASLAAALLEAGHDVYCLDWGIPRDEERHLTWDELLGRLARAVRFVRRRTGHARVGLLGYSMGATLAGIQAALHPEQTKAVVNLAGPFDFSVGGFVHMTDERWFDVDAIVSAGNVPGLLTRSGFVALHPTLQLAKWASVVSRHREPGFLESFNPIEAWVNDGVPFPAEVYRTYLRDFYQANALVAGQHWVTGRRVDLGAIDCPVLAITADDDDICPREAATALLDAVSSDDTTELRVPGGHVDAVAGPGASVTLYPAITQWLRSKLWN